MGPTSITDAGHLDTAADDRGTPTPADAPPRRLGIPRNRARPTPNGVASGTPCRPRFPTLSGRTIADDASPDPVSAAYAIAEGDPAQIAEWMQTSLEMATYSTEGLSGPFEDGGFVLDSVGDDDCRIQTTITPLGTLIIVTVRYGAACPF